jgi:hypothetical protein
MGVNHSSKKNVNAKNDKNENQEEKKDDKSNQNAEEDNISVGNMTRHQSTSADTSNNGGLVV